MNRTILISAIGMLTLLLSQGYWLANLYLDKKAQYLDLIEESLTYSIDNELVLKSGLFGKSNNTNKPKLIIKSAEEMTSEEIKSHKGDTIVLQLDSLSHARKGISTFFAQSSIEMLLKNHSFPMAVLDSIFKNEIQKNIPYATCQLKLCSKNGQIIVPKCNIYKWNRHIITAIHPIGTKGELHPSLCIHTSPANILPSLLCIDCLFSDDNHYHLLPVLPTDCHSEYSQETATAATNHVHCRP